MNSFSFTDLFRTNADLFVSISVSIAAVVFLYYFRKDRSVLAPVSLLSALTALAAGFSFAGALFLGMEAAGKPEVLLSAYESVSELFLSGKPSILWISAFFVTVPLAEELVFRGILQKMIQDHFGEAAAVLVSVSAFALYGYARDGIPGVPLCVFSGLFSSLFFLMTESVWPSVFVQIGVRDAFTLLWIRYFLSDKALWAVSLVSLAMSALLVYAEYRTSCSSQDSDEEEEEEWEDSEKDETASGKEGEDEAVSSQEAGHE